MGLLDGFTSGVNNVKDQLSPDMLLNSAGGFSTGTALTDALGGGVQGAMKGLLGLDPNCPGGAGGGGGGGGGDNDPCGKGSNPLAEAALGLGMALAGPSIAEAGAFLGEGLDSGLGAASSFLGDGITTSAGALGDVFGASDATKGLMSNALGSGVGAAIGGNDLATSGAAALTVGAKSINDTSINNSSSKEEKGFFEKIGESIGF